MSPSKLVVAVLSGAAALGPWTFGCSEGGTPEEPQPPPAANPSDAGQDDAGQDDAGQDDAGQDDAGATDDAGPNDAGATDDAAVTPDPPEAGECEAREEDQCSSCTRESCCGELGTYLGASDVDAFEACAEECVDDACVEACANASPAAGAANDELVSCQTDSCAEPCVCEAVDDDSSCLACVKERCCSTLVPLVLASDFDEFTLCMEPCTGGACDQDCISRYSAAGRAYERYSDCAFAECPAECG